MGGGRVWGWGVGRAAASGQQASRCCAPVLVCVVALVGRIAPECAHHWFSSLALQMMRVDVTKFNKKFGICKVG